MVFLDPFYYRVITIVATDNEGMDGDKATVTVKFNRTCIIWSMDEPTIAIPEQLSVSELGICTSASRFNIYISGNALSLGPLSDLQVSHLLYVLVYSIMLLYSLECGYDHIH